MSDLSYWGKYRAIVRDVADPEKRGRIRVFCPQVMGSKDDSGMWLDWALPCLPPYAFNLPKVDDGVWVEFEQGDPSHPVWTGVWLSGEDADTSEASTEAKDSYPDNRVFKTPGGHTLEVNDKTGEERIRITHKSGAIIHIEPDGKVKITSPGTVSVDGSEVLLGEGSKQVVKVGDTITGLISPVGPVTGTIVSATPAGLPTRVKA